MYDSNCPWISYTILYPMEIMLAILFFNNNLNFFSEMHAMHSRCVMTWTNPKNRIRNTKYVILVFLWVTSFCFDINCSVLCAHFHSLFFLSLIPAHRNLMGSFNGCLPVIRNSQLFLQSQMYLYKRILFLPLMCIYYSKLSAINGSAKPTCAPSCCWVVQ